MSADYSDRFIEAANNYVPEGGILEAAIIVVGFIGPDGEDYTRVVVEPSMRLSGALGLLDMAKNTLLGNDSEQFDS